MSVSDVILVNTIINILYVLEKCFTKLSYYLILCPCILRKQFILLFICKWNCQVVLRFCQRIYNVIMVKNKKIIHV